MSFAKLSSVFVVVIFSLIFRKLFKTESPLNLDIERAFRFYMEVYLREVVHAHATVHG
ncbi:hypothetical protein GCM10023183_18950 [Nibribacter koreensis]|uniref:Uncharacterized protein n=1 Tax=Nibribacter koreensis TaxID=1084519 RepID=A0ABP8FJ95_9BACT